MRLSELATETGVSAASLKYYLRESLLTPGEPVTRTQSEYGPAHVERVRLIRALVEVGGLTLAQVKQVIDALDSPTVPRLDLFGKAVDGFAANTTVTPDDDWTALAREFVGGRGWRIAPDDPLLPVLGSQLKALAGACPSTVAEQTLARWADAAERIAEADVATLPEDDAEALKIVVVGNVLSDRVLTTLRRLAQENRSAELYNRSGEPGSRR